MSQNVRLFPSYSQNENQTTNHCLLILKMLYEENPKFLAQVLSELLMSENLSGAVGVKFAQQRKSNKDSKSIPDGKITQEAFSILIETKLNGRDFTKDQLMEHLEELKNKKGERVLLALANFDSEIPFHAVFSHIEEEIKKLKDPSITFLAISFEQFLEAIRSIQQSYLPKNLVDAVSDLSEYFDENNLLPSWKHRLDVVNCSRYFDDVLQHKIYTCPATGGSYSHRRSLYFGTYRNKCVEQIARIEAVVDLDSDTESKLIWKNDVREDAELIKIALDRHQQIGQAWYPVRVFVLGDFFSTEFHKANSGGMQGAKKYFDIKKLQVKDAQDLAAKLNNKTWANFC